MKNKEFDIKEMILDLTDYEKLCLLDFILELKTNNTDKLTELINFNYKTK